MGLIATKHNAVATGPLGRGQTIALTGAGLLLIAVTYGLARFAYGLFVPGFRESFGLGSAQVGAIGSASYAAYCLAIVPALVFSPQLGSRAMATIAGSVATAGMALIALSPNAVILTAGVVLAGFSTGLSSPPLAQAVARRVRNDSQDRLQTVINAGTGLGVMLAGPVALIALDSWRAAWLVFAVLAAGATIWAAWSVPSAKSTSSEESESRRVLLPDPLVPRGAPRLLAAAAMAGLGSSAIWVFGRDVLSQQGLSDQAATIAWIVLGASGLVGAAAGDVAGRLGLAPTWVISVLAIGVSTALMVLVPGSTLGANVATGLFGGAYVAMSGLLLIAGAKTYHQHPAAGVGLAFLVLALGQTVGGSALGIVMNLLGSQVSFLAAALVAGLASCLVPSNGREARID